MNRTVTTLVRGLLYNAQHSYHLIITFDIFNIDFTHTLHSRTHTHGHALTDTHTERQYITVDCKCLW